MYSYGFFCPLLVLFSYSPLRLTCCLLSLSYLSSTRSPVLSWLSHSDRTWVPAWRRRVYTKSHGRGYFSIFVPVVELVPHRIPRKSPVGPSSNLPHTSSSSWPCHQDSRSRAIHGAGPSVLGFVPSAVGLYEKKDVSRPHQSGSGQRASKTRVLSRLSFHNTHPKLGTWKT